MFYNLGARFNGLKDSISVYMGPSPTGQNNENFNIALAGSLSIHPNIDDYKLQVVWQ